MQTQRPYALVFALALAACSSSNSTTTANAPAATTASGGEHHGEHHGAGHHANLSPTMTAFHDVLRPLWHSDAGADRDRRTCEQSATLVERADAISAAPVPESAQANAGRWPTAAAQLMATTRALATACAATPPANVASNLEAVHTAFHGLMELNAGEHH